MAYDLRKYRAWKAMHNRCYDKNVASYADYGARGIFVCERWHGRQGFHNFLSDMGERPEGTTLERIDNEGPYSPENCRWATKIEQANNKRNNHFVTAFGETHTLAVWARRVGCSYSNITRRMKLGMTAEEAIGKPVAKHPNGKLSDDDVRFIRSTYPMMTSTQLAKKFNVSKKTVLNVLHNRIYKDVMVT